MRELVNEIRKQLEDPSYVLKVSSDNLKLSKGKGKPMRFSFSLTDIQNYFKSIENFIQILKQKGFTTTDFFFYRMYGSTKKATYHLMKKTTINLDENFNQEIPAFNNSNLLNTVPQFLGHPTSSMPNTHYLGALVNSERAGDYKEKIDELKEELKDYRSKNRRLEDENHALKLKVDTAEERTELKIQQALNDKKSVLESDGFQSLAGVLAQAAPSILSKFNGAVPAQLGASENLSPVKNQAISIIKNSDDNNVAYAVLVLQNLDQELAELIENKINK